MAINIGHQLLIHQELQSIYKLFIKRAHGGLKKHSWQYLLAFMPPASKSKKTKEQQIIINNTERFSEQEKCVWSPRPHRQTFCFRFLF